MNPHQPYRLSAVPQTLHARLEIAGAIRTLAAQDEDVLVQRRTEIAAIRRECEALKRSIQVVGQEWLALVSAELRSELKKYSPDQPRVPAGNYDGGQWTNGGENGISIDRSGTADDKFDTTHGNSQPHATPINDSRVVSDVTPDNTWKPGAQYAGGIEEDENENRRVGVSGEPTLRQEVRLANAAARLKNLLSQVKARDPNWEPTRGFFSTPEGEINDLEAQAKEAENRLKALNRYGAGPGPYAGESIPARGPDREFTDEEREEINRIGDETGCHSCGVFDPGTLSGNFVPDHQPPSALNYLGGAQRLYPHCLICSLRQGGFIRQYLKGSR